MASRGRKDEEGREGEGGDGGEEGRRRQGEERQGKETRRVDHGLPQDVPRGPGMLVTENTTKDIDIDFTPQKRTKEERNFKKKRIVTVATYMSRSSK